jgi:hypothetical protein
MENPKAKIRTEKNAKEKNRRPNEDKQGYCHLKRRRKI